MQKRHALVSLLMSIPFVVMGCLLFTPTAYLRPRLDPKGNQMFHPDGRPMWKQDFSGELRGEWLAYTFLGLGSFFILRGIHPIPPRGTAVHGVPSLAISAFAQSV